MVGEAHQEYRQLFEARAEQQLGKALLKDTNPLMDVMWVLENHSTCVEMSEIFDQVGGGL